MSPEVFNYHHQQSDSLPGDVQPAVVENANVEALSEGLLNMIST
jgi:hypothetical protein